MHSNRPCARVLGQQISVAGAMTLAGRLVARLGPLLQMEAAPLSHVFPQAEAVAAAELEGLGMPRARAATLGTLARALIEQPDLLRPGQTLDAALARLCSLKGIGPWSAHYLALRQLGARDALPLGDVALLKALRLLEGRRRCWPGGPWPGGHGAPMPRSICGRH
jgi:DNA-3-methyladenine glycosylase II